MAVVATDNLTETGKFILRTLHAATDFVSDKTIDRLCEQREYPDATSTMEEFWRRGIIKYDHGDADAERAARPNFWRLTRDGLDLAQQCDTPDPLMNLAVAAMPHISNPKNQKTVEAFLKASNAQGAYAAAICGMIEMQEPKTARGVLAAMQDVKKRKPEWFVPVVGEKD